MAKSKTTNEEKIKHKKTLTKQTPNDKKDDNKAEKINTHKHPLSKKKLWTIIVSIVCAVVLIAIVISTAIIVTRRKLDMTPNSVITYNNHTNLRVVSPANNVTVYNESNPTYYSNGTVLVENEDTDTYGVYSYTENKQIIPTDYQFANITPITLNVNGEEIQENIFKVGNKFGEISNEVAFYNDEGEKLNISCYDSDKKENFAYIKQRKLNVSEKRKGVKVSIKDKFEDNKIYITSATYSTSYIVDGKYNYEIWNLTAKDGTTYKNLYKVENKQRELIQTINNLNGNSIELSDTTLEICFLKNNEPCFYTTQNITSSSGNSLLKINVYDINLNNIGSTDISTERLKIIFNVGNKLIFQFKQSTNEKEYDYAIGTSYYKVSTYSLNLKNGKYKEEKFDYLISDVNTEFNSETALIKAQKIDKKLLGDSQLLIMNDFLHTKEIDYEINTITQITNERFLVDNNLGQYIIDDKYNLICYLGNYDNYFTTGNAIMLSKTATGYTYVCSLDGIVVKKYETDKIINAYHDKYYMVKTTTKKDDGEYNEVYLETLGVRQETPLYSQKADSESYIYKGVEYVAYNDTILKDGVSIITRVRKNGDYYTYEFYNIDGDKLLQLDNFISTNRVLNHWHYEDDESVLLYISTNVGGIGYTLMVDR